MAGVLDRLVLLLAGSGLSRKDLRRLAIELQEVKPAQLVDAVENLRKKVARRTDAEEVAVADERGTPESRGRPNASTNMERRIERLLRTDAGLTVQQAATELLAALRSERPGAFATVGLPNKESFQRWLRRLSRRTEPSELLHHATRVRSRHVSRVDSDWPLLPR